MKTKPSIIVILLLILISISACNSSIVQTRDKPVIVVSIVPQAAFVREIAGSLVEVVTMIPPGSSPETYSPTPKELKAFSDASVYFTMGVPSEEANILPKSKDFNENLKIVHLEKEVTKIWPDIEISPGQRDPHIWLSPKRVKVMVDIVAQELSLVDPDNIDFFRKNAQNFKFKLDETDSKIRGILGNLRVKSFIAYHPAFGYFADDYGLTMIALEEEGKEATPQSFKKTIDLAKEKDIKVIFYQAEVDSRQSEAFAKEIGGKTERVAPLAPDYIENLERMAKTFQEVLK